MVGLHRARGRVLGERGLPSGAQELRVEVDGKEARALNYPELTGPVAVGAWVELNTTAVDLGLGTGGYHFVAAVEGLRRRWELAHAGHIMKLRYTPHQVRCLAVEEEASPYRAVLEKAESLRGLPVVVGELHSMVAPAAAGAQAVLGPGARIVYIMTDAAALPLSFSQSVPLLKEKGLLTATITAGQAFGGDLEAVNVYTALLAARWVLAADVAIVAMGPGTVGTGTRFGFSGIEQGPLVDAVNVLEGQPVAVLRLSRADQRARHRGVSHHTLTSLGRIAQTQATVALPELEDREFAALVARQLEEAGIASRHRLVQADGKPGLDVLAARGVALSSMGRTPSDDPPFFLAAAAAGWIAGEMSTEMSPQHCC